MGREIERKFLVRNEDWRHAASGAVTMRQGYLSQGGKASVRVRIEGERATLNIKSATLSIERQEFEYAIPPGEAMELLALCVDQCVEKTRHFVRCGAHVFEIDEFTGANSGLIIAEVELASIDEPFERPSWLGQDVSLDERYYNVYLARHPYREWESA